MKEMLIRGSFETFVDWWQCAAVMRRERGIMA
jgi:hypothetical protein